MPRNDPEAVRACEILGVNSVTFLNGGDGKLHLQPELANDILAVIERNTYRSVFCPWQQDNHSDHQATYELLLRALRACTKDLEVWLYEVWSPLKPNILVAIDSTIDAKMEAMRVHETQLGCLDYLRAFEGLARYRSLFCPSSKYAEAFFTCNMRALLTQ